MATDLRNPTASSPSAPVPPPEQGDRLTRDEFERRYRAMPHLKKAELIEGVVYVASPVSSDDHAELHGLAMAWLGGYYLATPGVALLDNATIRLDLDNEPQPDAALAIDPSRGGQSRRWGDGYTEGAPELVLEVASSRASYDLHDKLQAYRRNGVREYVVHRVRDRAIDWFVLRGAAYQASPRDGEGLLKSEQFPGLWLDPDALVRQDRARIGELIRRGLASAEHAAFVARLAGAGDASV